MADNYVVMIEGLDRLPAKSVQDSILLSAVRAINSTADFARARGAREIRRQVNLPASYLTGGAGARLAVAKRATRTNLEAIVRGRDRPTSLARFKTSGEPGPRQKGVTVQVKPGFSRYMRRAFLIRLRRGTELTDTQFNLGLAIRLKPGESISNKRQMLRFASNVYLLYGPSVGQVFKGVSGDMTPAIFDAMESEFLRLVDLGL